MDLSALPTVPTDPADIPGYLQTTMTIITDALVALDDIERKHDVAPDKPIEGLERYADGTNWNPGSGAGKYRYIGGSWVLIMGAAGIAAYLPLAGGTMTGEIDMGTDKIIGVVDPTADQDAATKKYVDGAAPITNAIRVIGEYMLTEDNELDYSSSFTDAMAAATITFTELPTNTVEILVYIQLQETGTLPEMTFKRSSGGTLEIDIRAAFADRGTNVIGGTYWLPTENNTIRIVRVIADSSSIFNIIGYKVGE